ncbi:hypothetical protein D791_03950 [Nitrincola nitratireducens]|uniref:Uncharacterized protein n=1 Tax=Nitrincola nitratireducens TaxID=1229521 RepID=W9VEI6_9GAMM|nr:hypothetical protein D791_03950 [Nitrincola nitratireducens]
MTTKHSTNFSVDPVVGWVVIVKGLVYGTAFSLVNGANTIGRSDCRINLNFGA